MLENRHSENGPNLLAMMLARSEALWGRERTDELRSNIEAMTSRLLELSRELPHQEEEPGQ